MRSIGQVTKIQTKNIVQSYFFVSNRCQNSEPHRGRDPGADHGVGPERRRHHLLQRVHPDDEEEEHGAGPDGGT